MAKLKVGILGVAKIATTKVIPPMFGCSHAEPAAIASRTLAKAEAAAAELGIARAYGSYEELLADPAIEEAARTLGATRGQVFRRVTVPQIMPGLVAGGIFAFVTSFDNYPVSMWLSDALNIPLPLTIFALTSRFFDPGIAAIASLTILLSVVLVLIVERVAGLRRAMSM